MSQMAVPFNELMEGVLDQLRNKGYMESTLIVYRRIYTRVRAFLVECGTDIYTHEIGSAFLAGTKVKKSTYTAYTCVIRRLDDFIDRKPYRSHHDCPLVQISPEFTCILDKFLQACRDKGNKCLSVLKSIFYSTCHRVLLLLPGFNPRSECPCSGRSPRRPYLLCPTGR